MTHDFETWLSEANARAIEKTAIFTPQQKEELKLDYPERLLKVVPRYLAADGDIDEFKLHADTLIAALPETTDLHKANLTTYTALVTESRLLYTKKYNLLQKGQLRNKWFAVCLALGVAFGIAFKKLGLGIPFGLLLGIMIGTSKERKAEAEGKVL